MGPDEVTRLTAGLNRLARNLWWTWNQEAQEVFQEDADGKRQAGNARDPGLLQSGEAIVETRVAAGVEAGPGPETVQGFVGRTHEAPILQNREADNPSVEFPFFVK